MEGNGSGTTSAVLRGLSDVVVVSWPAARSSC